MTNIVDNLLRDKAIREEGRKIRLHREQNNLTVRKKVIIQASCDFCQHTWPYTEGDEDKPCPACQGGSGKFWTTGGTKTGRVSCSGPNYSQVQS